MKLQATGALLLAASLSSCARPSVIEVNSELSRLVNPALEAALAGAPQSPEAVTGTTACSDPFFGPRQGVRPGIEYRIPFESLGENPDSFALRAAGVWEDMGLTVDDDDTDTIKIRFATKRGYSLTATVNHANQEALMSGTGPCVDDPEAD
jgi:hypothetical protein